MLQNDLRRWSVHRQTRTNIGMLLPCGILYPHDEISTKHAFCLGFLMITPFIYGFILVEHSAEYVIYIYRNSTLRPSRGFGAPSTA